MATSHVLHRITVEEYRRMADGGVFDPDARLELIDGELIEPVAPMNAPHGRSIIRMNRVLVSAFGDVAVVCCQLPVTLGDFSEPEPDFAIVRAPDSRYERSLPVAADVHALVEVSDTSRMFDLTRKVPIYAKHAIPEVWLVDVVDRCVRVFRDPDGNEYRERNVVAADETVAFAAFPSIVLGLSEIF